MIQVYYSKMTDLLLAKDGTFRRLIIVKDQQHGVVNVVGANKVPIDFSDEDALAKIWKQGLDNRKMRASDINETSSRSHLIFSIFIERRKKGESTLDGIGKITCIDLAGSECLARIGVDESLYEEGLTINESLHKLGRAIRQAAYNVEIRYDLHVLTQLMQDSLGGKAKTLMIANIGPSVFNIRQSRDTLEYAVSCGTITTKSSDYVIQCQLAKQSELAKQ